MPTIFLGYNTRMKASFYFIINLLSIIFPDIKGEDCHVYDKGLL